MYRSQVTKFVRVLPVAAPLALFLAGVAADVVAKLGALGQASASTYSALSY